jgi:Mor family transcriptional regulator
MSYINAKDVLPKEIQKYVNGVNLYIPKVPEENSNCSNYKLELYKRNQEIYNLFLQGEKVSKLAAEYYLSDKSIYRILGEMKKK